MAVRVHELATELEVEVDDLIAELGNIDISVRNHMSRIKEAQVEQVYAHYKGKKNSRALDWTKQQEEDKNDPAAQLNDQNLMVEQALARAAAARARAEAERKSATAVVERQKADDIRKTPATGEKTPRAAVPSPLTPETVPTTLPSAPPLPPGATPTRRPVARISPQRVTANMYPPGVVDPNRPRETGRPSPGKRTDTRGPRDRGSAPDTPVDLSRPLPTIEVMKLDEGHRGSRRRDRRKPGKADEPGRDAISTQRRRTGPRPSRPVPGASGRRGAKPRSLVAKKSSHRPIVPTEPVIRKVTVHGDVTVAQLADKMRIDAADIIRQTLMMGSPLTLNETLSEEMIELLGPEFGFEIEMVPDTDEHDVEEYARGDIDADSLQTRPPVVTIMGHVDHGKTSLFEQIAKLEILQTEHGGITQHIGAYHVQSDRGDIVFLDTPGHAAFTAMRQRGAQATDIVVLVVAADDGVMPQTIEAINHSKAANVPIIVAINKIDLPGANPDKIKQQLMTYEMVSEELGGDTLFCEISAKEGIGIDDFLDTLLLQAEMLELGADPTGNAEGLVIEAERSEQRGIEATVLVKQGTLNVGDTILSGRTFGRIRTMFDHLGRPVESAGPSFPARVYGLSGEAPEAGEPFIEMPNEREARHIADIRAHRRRNAGFIKRQHVSLEGLQEYLMDSEVKELRVILKGDVQGSLEAIVQSLEKIPSDNAKTIVLHSAVGSVSESDVRLAAASDAIILGFNVRPDPSAASLASQEGVEIKGYTVIYDLLDEVQSALLGLLDTKYKEVEIGKAEVLEIFKISRFGTVAGCFVNEGEVRNATPCRLVRDGAVVYTGKIGSLRRVKDTVERVQNGLECGIALDSFNDVKKGDIIEAYALEELERVL